MKKNNLPLIFMSHITKEFLNSLTIFMVIILTLIIITNYVEEFFYLRDFNLVKNLYLTSLYHTIIKTPSLLLNLFPFVFLFASIHFFVKILRNNEFISLKISGISNLSIILIPSIFSFFIGILLILIFSPIASHMTKIYENTRKHISGDENLIIINDNGIWIKEEKNNQIIIVKAEKLIQSEAKLKLENILIFKNNFIEKKNITYKAKNALIHSKKWELIDAIIFENNKKKTYDKIIFDTNIKLEELKDIFSNADAFSIYNIVSYLETINKRGYLGDELLVKFHKFISFPFLLFSTVIFATVFTINLKSRFDNFVYSFFGIISGIFIYFLIDLSIALGKSGRLSLNFSVWAPIILILILCFFSLLRSNEN